VRAGLPGGRQRPVGACPWRGACRRRAGRAFHGRGRGRRL